MSGTKSHHETTTSHQRSAESAQDHANANAESAFLSHESKALGLQGGGEGNAQPNILQRSISLLNNAGVSQRSRILLQVQRTQGNHFASQVVKGTSSAGIIQRDPPTAAPAPAAAPASGLSAPATWTPPFDLAPASKKAEAAFRLLQMMQQLDDLKESMGDLDKSQIDSANGGLRSLIGEMSSEDTLTVDDVNKLSIASSYAKTAADSGRQALTAVITQAIQSLFSADTGDMSSAEGDLQEEMRKAFLTGSDPSRIAQIKSALSAVGKYKGYADKVADWAKKANGLLNSAKLKDFLENFGKRSKQLGEGLKYINQVVDAAKAINGILTDQGPGESANQIAKFEATIAAIDIAMGFAKAVPVMGQLWSSYYKPLTEACIKHMKVIFRLTDEKKRDLTLLEWMTDGGKDRGPGGVPVIPPLHMSAFPGGQMVLNYMYPLVNGGSPAMSPAVEQFFIKHKSLFNAGAEKNDSIETEWHLFSKDTSPNLVPWITRNADTVWAMLYGNMQKNI